MALSGSGPALGARLAEGAGSVDPPGVLAWAAIGTAIVTWLPSAVIPQPIGAIPLAAAGAVVTGVGSLTVSGAPLLAIAAGSLDPAGILRWGNIALAVASWLTAHGGIDPSLLVANPSGGALTGTGAIVFSSTDIGPSLASAAGSTDPPGIAAWANIGNSILSHIMTNAVVAPGAMVSPNGGGPVTGAGVLS